MTIQGESSVPSNKEKLISLLNALRNYKDTNIQINVAVGKTLMEWLDEPTGSEPPRGTVRMLNHENRTYTDLPLSEMNRLVQDWFGKDYTIEDQEK